MPAASYNPVGWYAGYWVRKVRTYGPVLPYPRVPSTREYRTDTVLTVLKLRSTRRTPTAPLKTSSAPRPETRRHLPYQHVAGPVRRPSYAR